MDNNETELFQNKPMIPNSSITPGMSIRDSLEMYKEKDLEIKDYCQKGESIKGEIKIEENEGGKGKGEMIRNKIMNRIKKGRAKIEEENKQNMKVEKNENILNKAKMLENVLNNHSKKNDEYNNVQEINYNEEKDNEEMPILKNKKKKTNIEFFED